MLHPNLAAEENAKNSEAKKLRSRSPSAEKNVAFVPQSKKWADDEEYEDSSEEE